MSSLLPTLSTAQILALRPGKNRIDPHRPYAYLVEPERAASGQVVDVATLFLSNRECPFRCLMCDLWQNTTDETVPIGAIVEQIEFALNQLPPARQIKLYNSGNFFDPRAIPVCDHARIADCIRAMEHVIVENHPRFCHDECLRFRDRLSGTLEVAIGLETIHPEVLPALNKQMTLQDFDRATAFLTSEGIAVRTFILLRPPGLDEEEGVEWAMRSIDRAFAVGASCCSVIPTRAGNGAMEQLQQMGHFAPPRLRSLERVLTLGIERQLGRVFVDLWNAAQFADCDKCSAERIGRLQRMNLAQRVEPHIACACGGSA